MRVKPSQVRALASIALQRTSERELRTLHEFINNISAVAFVEMVRDIEDEIESSLAIGFERNVEQDLPGLEFSGLYAELEKIRRKDLGIPVYRFAELLTNSLKNDPDIRESSVPSFDSRRGLQAWIKRLVRTYSEQQVYRAANDVRDFLSDESGTAWKLR